MHKPEEAMQMIEDGEHVVEIIVTWMDGTYEVFYPSVEGGWTSSIYEQGMNSDFLVINHRERCNRLEIPLANVRYYEVLVHNDPHATRHVCDEHCQHERHDREGVQMLQVRLNDDGSIEPIGFGYL